MKQIECTYSNPVEISGSSSTPQYAFSSSTCTSTDIFSTSTPELAPISGGELIIINIALVVVFLWLTGGIMSFVFRKKKRKRAKSEMNYNDFLSVVFFFLLIGLTEAVFFRGIISMFHYNDD